MQTETIKQNTIARPVDSYSKRGDAVADAPITLYLRRPLNSPSYRHEVRADSLSSRGAHIICDVPIEIGAELLVSGFYDRFAATAVVNHIQSRRDGTWSIELKFLKKSDSRIDC